MAAQPIFCLTLLEIPKDWFSHDMAHISFTCLQQNTTRKAPKRRKRSEMPRRPNWKKVGIHQPGGEAEAEAGTGADW